MTDRSALKITDAACPPREPRIQRGHTVVMDNGRHAVLGCCDWGQADYRLAGDWAGGLKGWACRVIVTGRMVRYSAGPFRGGSIRVLVTFPGDGEPATNVKGWVSANEALYAMPALNPIDWCSCGARCTGPFIAATT